MLMSKLPSRAAAPEQGTLLPRVSTLLGGDRPCTMRAQPGRRGTRPVKKLITLRAKTSNPQALEIWERPSSAVHPYAAPGTQTHTHTPPQGRAHTRTLPRARAVSPAPLRAPRTHPHSLLTGSRPASQQRAKLCSLQLWLTWQLNQSSLNLALYPSADHPPTCPMGTYLGRPCPSPPPQALGVQHLPGRLGCPQPDPCTRRFSVAGPGHPAVRAPRSTLRPAPKCPVTLHLRFVTASLRRCSTIPQALRSFLGVLTSLCRRHQQRKAALGARISTMCRGSAPAVGTVPACDGRQQQVTPVPPTTLSCAPGSCTEKTVRRALGESGKGLAQQEEDPALTEEGHHKGGPDGSRGARSALRPLGARGGFSAFVPRPGPLRGNLHAKSSADRSTEKLQTSCGSSCPPRNAITSSHSSTRAFPPGQRSTGPRTP